MRALFLLHDDEFALLKADHVAARFPFEGFVVVGERRPPALPFLWRRARRLGFLRVADEVLFRLYYRLRLRRRDAPRIAAMVDELRTTLPDDYRRPPLHRVANLNSAPARELLTGLSPDVCVATVNVLLKRSVFSIPTLGTWVYHPGITPEYRGVHAAFWALARGDLGRIGWSLLRVDDGIDTGHVIAQGTTTAFDPARDSHVVLQHRAHIDGLPEIAAALEAAAGGTVPHVDTSGRESNYFSHPGLSDFLRARR